MNGLRLMLAAATTCAGFLASCPAEANGRYPEANQLLFAQHDPELVLLRVSFGLLISHDRGRTFDYICEQSIGFNGIEDPMYTVTPSNAYVGSTFQGLTISRDQGCGWAFAQGELTQQVFIDLSANPRDLKNIVVFASSYDTQDSDGGSLFSSNLWETKDEGQTFQHLGLPLDPTLLGYTVDLTASDPDRIYLTGIREPGMSNQGVLLTSKNHGQSWEELIVPLAAGERALFIAAVDPVNAERVYLRTSGGTDKPTRLLLREADSDGGTPTLRVIHTATGALSGFALTPDGTKVYIGGPRDGVKVAATTDFAFEQRSNVQVQCLALNGEGLWACSNEANGFIAGLSKDEGATFEPRLRFCDIRGPLICPTGSVTTPLCNSIWPQQKALLGCGGMMLDGGTGTEAGGSADAGARRGTTSSSDGCGCGVAATSPWGVCVSVVAVLTAFARRRRCLPR